MLIKSEVFNEGVWPSEQLNEGVYVLRVDTDDFRGIVRGFTTISTLIDRNLREWRMRDELFSLASICSCKYAPADGNLPMINRPAATLSNARGLSRKIIARPPYYCQIDRSMKMLFTAARWLPFVSALVSWNDNLDSASDLAIRSHPRGNIA